MNTYQMGHLSIPARSQAEALQKYRVALIQLGEQRRAMARKTKGAPQRRALSAAVMQAVDQVTPALAQKLKATMPMPAFQVNEMLDMIIPDRGVGSLL